MVHALICVWGCVQHSVMVTGLHVAASFLSFIYYISEFFSNRTITIVVPLIWIWIHVLVYRITPASNLTWCNLFYVLPFLTYINLKSFQSGLLLFRLFWLVCVCVWSEGPCLVHTITGDLLRALEGPENCQQPRLISVSSEGHCIIYYERGHFCNFSINGKLLAQMELNDSTRVSCHTVQPLVTHTDIFIS